MIQSLLLDRGSRTLAEQISRRLKSQVPVIIEITASRRALSGPYRHIDAINFFDGVIDRLDRTLPHGWRDAPPWSELDRGPGRRAGRQRLYLYAQGRMSFTEMRAFDDAGRDLARSANLRFGLALAPGIAMSSERFRRLGSGDARAALLGLVVDEADFAALPGCYAIRARWVVRCGRPAAAPGRERLGACRHRAPPARLYLTLYRRTAATRRAAPRGWRRPRCWTVPPARPDRLIR